MKKNSTSIKVAILIMSVMAFKMINAQTIKTTYQNQQSFIDMRFGMFIHFNLGTFTDQEWALPNQDPKLFAPTAVNCDQWAAAAKAAGMKFAVLTTKHHDGFALWPTKYGKKNKFGTYQNVMYSSYKQDVVKLYVDAFRKAGVTPCLYFSIWDRTEVVDSTHFTQENLDFIVGQLTELLTNYGEIPFLMFDGWTWQMGHNRVPYQLIRETVKKLQPNCLIADHNGLTQPFEEDILNFEHFEVPNGNKFAATRGMPVWPKWFWHPAYPTTAPISAASISSRLSSCQANWANLLLDCPPNRDGVLDANLVSVLTQVGSMWKINTTRGTLPVPEVQLEHPVKPVAITASSTSTSTKLSSAIDGMNDFVSGVNIQSLWQSNAAPSTSNPQSVTLDFGNIYSNIELLEYMPTQSRTTGNDITTVSTIGNITSYNVYVSTDNKTFTKVATGTWKADGYIKKVRFNPSNARYIRLEATATNGGGPAIISEVDAGGVSNIPTVVSVITSTDDDSENTSESTHCTPNPYSTDFCIRTKGAFSYQIYDLKGNLVEQSNGENEIRTGLSLKQGLYLVNIRDDKGNKFVKVIKD